MIQGNIFVEGDSMSKVNRIVLHLISGMKEIKQEDVVVGAAYFSSHNQVKLLRGGAKL